MAVYADTANWHFYSVTYTYGAASSCTLYVDGVAVAGGWIAGNGSDAPASTLGGPVLIGTDGTGTASNGSLYDNISIYNGILSASQVLALYNSGTSTADTLLASTPLALPQISTRDAAFGFVNSQFGFNLTGAAGQKIVVEGSADLVNLDPAPHQHRHRQRVLFLRSRIGQPEVALLPGQDPLTARHGGMEWWSDGVLALPLTSRLTAHRLLVAQAPGRLGPDFCL